MSEHKRKIGIALQNSLEQWWRVRCSWTTVVKRQYLRMVFEDRVKDLKILVKCLLAVCMFFSFLVRKNLEIVIFYLGYVLLFLNIVHKRLFAFVG